MGAWSCPPSASCARVLVCGSLFPLGTPAHETFYGCPPWGPTNRPKNAAQPATGCPATGSVSSGVARVLVILLLCTKVAALWEHMQHLPTRKRGRFIPFLSTALLSSQTLCHASVVFAGECCRLQAGAAAHWCNLCSLWPAASRIFHFDRPRTEYHMESDIGTGVWPKESQP